MQKYGIPGKIVKIVKLFYDGFQYAVEGQGERGEWFDFKTGIKQGCNMSGFLFVMAVDWIMRKTVRNGESGIRWKLTSNLDDLDVADDVALLSSTRQHVQDKTTRMNEAAKRVGLKINQAKTKVLRINARNQTKITFDGQEIEEVDEFTSWSNNWQGRRYPGSRGDLQGERARSEARERKNRLW